MRAAEHLIFSLSIESCVPGGWKKVQWEEAEREDGFRKLVLDETIVEVFKFGLDAVTCVMYIFPLVFMGKLVNEVSSLSTFPLTLRIAFTHSFMQGLLTADLIVIHQPTVQPPWLSLQKLPRLLELGASFLDSIAPDNPHHPAKAQARVLRTLLETGLRGRIHVAKAAGIALTAQTYRHVGVPSEPFPPPPRAPPRTSSGGTLLSQPPISSQPLVVPPNYSSLVQGMPAPSSSTIQNQPWDAPVGSPFLPSTATSPFGSTEGMDLALTSVLEGFDPLFGESSAFWEWGGGSDVDWAKIQESMGQ